MPRNLSTLDIFVCPIGRFLLQDLRPPLRKDLCRPRLRAVVYVIPLLVKHRVGGSMAPTYNFSKGPPMHPDRYL